MKKNTKKDNHLFKKTINRNKKQKNLKNHNQKDLKLNKMERTIQQLMPLRNQKHKVKKHKQSLQ